jgi:serine/threonine-protein kinase
MFRLVTFGGLSLADPGGAPVAVPRLRLAFLALLAGAGERGLTRDKILAYLWPESAAEPARHALEQLLYSLRRQLPKDLVSGSDPLRFNPAVISADVGEFEGALAAGEPAEAVALYRGPFLDGFFLTDAPLFGEWVERERDRLAGEHARALRRLAQAAAGEGRHTAEIDWWRRLSAADPLDERSAIGLIRALAGAGDGAGAMRYARAFETLLRRELASPPSAELRAEMERLRKAAAPVPEREESDRYPIVRELGRGGMAKVYLARDRKHDRLVALKVLRPDIAAALGTKRFLREIAIVARLHHPHILPLYDSGELEPPHPAAGLFYTMPYGEGESLRQRLERDGPLPVGEALRIGCEVAEALGYAHTRGVIHRDIRPENILLENGHARVTDFGIAHAVDLAGGEQLSMSGVRLGSPGYMSPEQAAGEPALTPRSDLYGLACVLYEMLAGEPPFTGATSQAVLARQARGEIPALRTVCPAVPPAAERAIVRALSPTPEGRQASAVELAEALRVNQGAQGR